MANRINSASRLSAILKTASTQGSGLNNEATYKVWGGVFDVHAIGDHQLAMKVSERMVWMRQELEVMHKLMSDASYDPELYVDACMRIESLISPLNFTVPWDQVRRSLPSDVLVTLKFCAAILPDEESEIPPDQLEDIRKLVSELAVILESSTLPTRLQAIIRHQIEIIKRALDEYSISGVRALRKAVWVGAGEVTEQREIIEAAKDSPEIGKLAGIWKKVTDVVEVGSKASETLKLLHEAFDAISDVIS